jgi:hypothetical protein
MRHAGGCTVCAAWCSAGCLNVARCICVCCYGVASRSGRRTTTKRFLTTKASEGHRTQTAHRSDGRSRRDATRTLQHATRTLQHAARTLQHAHYNMQHAARILRHATRTMQHAAHNRRQAARTREPHAAQTRPAQEGPHRIPPQRVVVNASHRLCCRYCVGCEAIACKHRCLQQGKACAAGPCVRE